MNTKYIFFFSQTKNPLNINKIFDLIDEPSKSVKESKQTIYKKKKKKKKKGYPRNKKVRQN